MLKSVVAALLVSAVVALPAVAATVTDRSSCELALKDVQAMRAASVSGPRVNQETDQMIVTAGNQCQKGDYAEAEKTLLKLRALLATE